jgi:tetratricopeptide (TPR) repeat protein
MNPFAAQQRAFVLTDAGNFTEASRLFFEALKAFRRLVSDERMRQYIVARAAAIPDHEESAEEIAAQFLHQLPVWLRELHFENFYKALTSYDWKTARLHWALLVAWAEEANLSRTSNLDLLREQVCQRRQVTHKAVDNEGDSQSVLARAEDILAIDGGNNAARRVAIAVYTTRLQSVMERLTKKKRNEDVAQAINKLNPSKKQRLHDSRRTVRRLRQHLRRAQSRADADVDEMVRSYRQLSHYFLGVGELETAIKLTRRARRLLPDDEELRGWARGIRRLRRRG